MHAEGKSIKEIAASLELSTQTTRNLVYRYPDKDAAAFAEIEKQKQTKAQQIAEEYKSGATLLQLGSKYGVSGERIRQWLEEIGVTGMKDKLNRIYREHEIERHLVWHVERMGGRAYKFTSPSNRGVADRIVCLPDGRTWFVEVKAPKGRLSALQNIFAEEMLRLRQPYACLWSKEMIDEWVKEL
jgi:transposase